MNKIVWPIIFLALAGLVIVGILMVTDVIVIGNESMKPSRPGSSLLH